MNISDNIKLGIIDFLLGTERNCWVRDSTMEVYLRKSQRYCCRTIDVASINVESKYQGKGLFTNLIKFLLLFHFDLIFVENIQNPRLYNHLIRKGAVTAIEPECLCLYK